MCFDLIVCTKHYWNVMEEWWSIFQIQMPFVFDTLFPDIKVFFLYTGTYCTFSQEDYSYSCSSIFRHLFRFLTHNLFFVISYQSSSCGFLFLNTILNFRLTYFLSACRKWELDNGVFAIYIFIFNNTLTSEGFCLICDIQPELYIHITNIDFFLGLLAVFLELRGDIKRYLKFLL